MPSPVPAGCYTHHMSGSPPLEPDPVVETYKKDVDRTLIRENLRCSVEERFLRLMALQRFAEELRRAGRGADRSR
jgi:hypothetical protein